MAKKTQERLKEKDWQVGTVSDFLALSPEEERLVEIKLAFSQSLKGRRKAKMTQTELASKLGSSQPRVARAENRHDRVNQLCLILMSKGLQDE